MSVSTPWPYSSPRLAPQARQRPSEARLDCLHPKRLVDRTGRAIEVCAIGDLARALGKSPATIRRWERDGVIPRSPYVKAVRGGAPRRMYPVPWVTGLAALAEAEGIACRKPANISATSFERLARELHAEIFAR